MTNETSACFWFMEMVEMVVQIGRNRTGKKNREKDKPLQELERAGGIWNMVRPTRFVPSHFPLHGKAFILFISITAQRHKYPLHLA